MNFLKKNVVLIGMTGSGKTTIGKSLSKNIKKKFYDIDQEIEKITNFKIKDFFNLYGEKEFRRLEKGILIKLIEKDEKSVISPGAGIFYNDEVKKILLDKCICIYLDSDINTLMLRLKKNLSSRPKLSKGRLEDNLKQMYKERVEDYKKSHIKVSVNSTSVQEVVTRIIRALSKYE